MSSVTAGDDSLALSAIRRGIRNPDLHIGFRVYEKTLCFRFMLRLTQDGGTIRRSTHECRERICRRSSTKPPAFTQTERTGSRADTRSAGATLAAATIRSIAADAPGETERTEPGTASEATRATEWRRFDRMTRPAINPSYAGNAPEPP
jgi:hypothetical protein